MKKALLIGSGASNSDFTNRVDLNSHAIEYVGLISALKNSNFKVTYLNAYKTKSKLPFEDAEYVNVEKFDYDSVSEYDLIISTNHNIPQHLCNFYIHPLQRPSEHHYVLTEALKKRGKEICWFGPDSRPVFYRPLFDKQYREQQLNKLKLKCSEKDFVCAEFWAEAMNGPIVAPTRRISRILNRAKCDYDGRKIYLADIYRVYWKYYSGKQKTASLDREPEYDYIHDGCQRRSKSDLNRRKIIDSFLEATHSATIGEYVLNGVPSLSGGKIIHGDAAMWELRSQTKSLLYTVESSHSWPTPRLVQNLLSGSACFVHVSADENRELGVLPELYVEKPEDMIRGLKNWQDLAKEQIKQVPQQLQGVPTFKEVKNIKE